MNFNYYYTRFIYIARKATDFEPEKIGINTFTPNYTFDTSDDFNYSGNFKSNGVNILATKQDNITFDTLFLYNHGPKI